MFKRFTRSARNVVTGARMQAQELGHPRIGTEHLLLAMLAEQDSTTALLREAGLTAPTVRAAILRAVGTPGGLLTDAEAAALESIGIDIDAVRARIEESFGPGVLEQPETAGHRGRLPFSPRSKKVLELSLREALRLKQNWIGSEHILLGLLREGAGLAALVMTDAGVDLAALRRATEDSLRAAAA